MEGRGYSTPWCVALLRSMPGKQGLASWFSTLAGHQNYLGRLNPDAWGFTTEQLIFGSEAKSPYFQETPQYILMYIQCWELLDGIYGLMALERKGKKGVYS